VRPGATASRSRLPTSCSAYQRLLDPRVAAPYASYYYIIKNAAKINAMSPKDPDVDAAVQSLGVKAVDDNTFQITLESPAGYFKWVASLWTGAPVRKDIVDKYGKDASGTDKWGVVAAGAAQSLIGNGQYKVSEVVTKDHITLVLNDKYTGSAPKPTITKITMSEIEDETVAYAKYTERRARLHLSSSCRHSGCQELQGARLEP